MMNIDRYFKVLVAVMVLSFSTAAFADEKIEEDAIEGEPRVFFLGENLSGAIRGSICDGCPEIKLTITKNSKAYVDNKLVSLSVMAKSAKKPELTFFNIKTKEVTRMYWQSE